METESLPEHLVLSEFIIPALTTNTGEQLINVPADETILQNLGFTQAEALQKIKDARQSLYLVKLKAKRNKLLFESDWSVVADSPMTIAEQTRWKTYRQALRDLPATFLNRYDEVVFPAPP